MTNGDRKPFTLDQVLDAAREAVNEKGSGYVYPGADEKCTYGDDQGKPSCIVGHVIFKLDPEVFANLAAVELDAGESKAVGDLEYDEWMPDNFWTSPALTAMRYAQESQDEGNTWGDALACAENLGADAE